MWDQKGGIWAHSPGIKDPKKHGIGISSFLANQGSARIPFLWDQGRPKFVKVLECGIINLATKWGKFNDEKTTSSFTDPDLGHLESISYFFYNRSQKSKHRTLVLSCPEVSGIKWTILPLQSPYRANGWSEELLMSSCEETSVNLIEF